MNVQTITALQKKREQLAKEIQMLEEEFEQVEDEIHQIATEHHIYPCNRCGSWNVSYVMPYSCSNCKAES